MIFLNNNFALQWFLDFKGIELTNCFNNINASFLGTVNPHNMDRILDYSVSINKTPET